MSKKKKNRNQNRDIPTYLEFIVFELNRVINRKNILENKAYILGTLLSSFVFFNKDFFNLFYYIEKIKNKEIFIAFLLNVFGIVCCIISFIFLYKTLNLSENRYLDSKNFKLEERINETKFEQEEVTIKHHLKTIEMINKTADKKSRYLSNSIKFGMCFFFTYFIFMLGGGKWTK